MANIMASRSHGETVGVTKDVGVKEHKWIIYWPTVAIFIIIHLSALYGFTLRSECKPASEVFMKIMILISGYGGTAGLHRLWSHKSFKATKLGEIILLILSSTSYQNSVYTWSRDHRMHHKYTETDADPHNAKRGFFFSHMGWLIVRKHSEVQKKKSTIDLSDLESNPLVMFQHKYYYWFVLAFTFGLHTFVPMYFFGESFKVAFFRVMMYKSVIFLHLVWTINSFAHLYGHKPYDKSINPVECKLLIHVGEQYHNYHHSFPWDYKCSELKSVMNSTTTVIDLMAYLGLVYDRRTATPELIDAKSYRKGDGTIDSNKSIFWKYFSESADKLIKNGWMFVKIFTFLYII